MRALAHCYPLVSIGWIAVTLLACTTDEPTTWESGSCRLAASPSFTPPPGDTAPSWTGCRAVYLTADDNANIPPAFFVQIMTAGTSGSVIDPGPGWLTLELHGDQEPARLTPTASNALLDVGAIRIDYVGVNGGGGRLSMGTVEVAALVIAAHGDGASSSTFDTEMDLDVSAMTSSGARVSIIGHLSVSSAP